MAQQLASWGKSAEAARVPMVANGFLELLSEVCVGWLLLDAGVLAASRCAAAEVSDQPFYAGKLAVADYFASWILPSVPGRAKTLVAASNVVLESDALSSG
jgi:hypothetical protein